MANKKGSTQGAGGKGRAKKQKQPTQKTAMQRVAIIGPTGKRRLEWRPW